MNLKDKLLLRLKEIKKVEKNIDKSDPFMQENAMDGSRSLDELGDEVVDLEQYGILSSTKEELKKETKDIKDTLDKIEKGKEGICERCGNDIKTERLAINPIAKYCIECQKEIESIPAKI
jgi:RNA polymerase-binding transcription factor DksA